MLHHSQSSGFENNLLSTSVDLDEQIKQLELEGNRLLLAANNLSDTLCLNRGRKTTPTPFKNHSPNQHCLLSTSSSTLVDFSAEQKAIDEIRAQLGSQSQETEQPNQRLLTGAVAAASVSMPSFGYLYPSTGSLLQKLDLPSVTWCTPGEQSVPSTNTRLNKPSNFLTEQKLSEAENEILDLRTKHDELVTICEKQREHFRATVEDLRQQLLATNTSKDAILRAKEIECQEQEKYVSRMRRHVEQLETANKTQEKTLLELNDKLEVCQREQRLTDSCLNQIRGQLLDQERKRGVFFNSTGGNADGGTFCSSVIDQNVTALVRSIDCCLQQLDLDVEVKKEKIKELTAQLTEERALFTAREQQLETQCEQRISELMLQHKQELNAANDSCAITAHRVAHLEGQISRLSEDYETRLQSECAKVRDAEQKLQLISGELDTEKKLSALNKSTLEKALDDLNRELVEIRVDRDQRIRESAAVESRYDDMRATIEELKSKLDAEKSEVSRMRNLERDLLAREQAAEMSRRNNENTLLEIKAALETAQLQHEMQLKEQVDRAGREGEHKSTVRVETLSFQVTALTEKCRQLTYDLENNRAQYQSLQERFNQLRQSHDSLSVQLNSTSQVREQLSTNLSDRTDEIGRLVRAIDAANAELVMLKSGKDMLSVQLEERENNFLLLKEQNDQLRTSCEAYLQREYDLIRDRDSLERLLKEKSDELKTVIAEKESALQRQLTGEDRIKSLEESKRILTSNLNDKQAELAAIEKVNANLTTELREAKYELSNLKDQVSSLQRVLEQREGSLGHELNMLTRKLQETEQQLRLSRKALKVHDETDEKAVEVAEKMQKEVTEKRNHIDSLCSKMHWLEDSLESITREKKMLEGNTKSLHEELNQVISQKDKLTIDNRQLSAKCNSLLLQLSQSEAAKETMMLQHAAAKSQAEQYAQDITRLRFRHQLELKELERTGLTHRSLQNTDVHVQPAAVGGLHAAVAANSTGAILGCSALVNVSPVTSDPKPAFSSSLPTAALAAAAAASVPVSSNAPAGLVQPRTSCLRNVTEYPTCMKPTGSSKRFGTSAAAAGYDSNVVGSELQRLVDEMRSSLSIPQTNNNQTSVSNSFSTHNSNDSDETLHGQDYSATINTSDLADWHLDEPVRDGSLAPSSVYDLLTGAPDKSSCSSNRDRAVQRRFTDTKPTGINIGNAGRSASRKHKRLRAPFQMDADTKALCERLEMKIENLSRIGGNLQKDNAELGRTIHDHGKKLSKVKKQFKQ